MVEGRTPSGFPGEATHVYKGKMELLSVESRDMVTCRKFCCRVEWGSQRRKAARLRHEMLGVCCLPGSRQWGV